METKKQEEVLLLKEQQEDVQLSKEQLKSILGGMSCDISTYYRAGECSSCEQACKSGCQQSDMRPVTICLIASSAKKSV